MKNILILVQSVSLLVLFSCASLDHQIPESEPHAVIRFIKPPSSEIAVSVEMMDGLTLRYDQDYRIRPGGHILVIERTGLAVETGNSMYAGVSFGNPDLAQYSQDNRANVNVSQDGMVTTSGIDPLASNGQFVNMSVESRQRTRGNQHIQVDAGWRYEHDGVIFRKTGKLP